MIGYHVEVKEQELMRNHVKEIKFMNKKNHFYFKKEEGTLIFNRSYSNNFITFCDSNNKVIICKTSGSSNVGFLKKQKKSPQSIEAIVKALVPYFELYRIQKFNIILKVNFSTHTIFMVKELLDYGYEIKSFRNNIKIAHSLLKGRKIRRI